MVSYAALELRFAIERLTIHYWFLALNRKPTDDEIENLGFKHVRPKLQAAAKRPMALRRLELIKILLDALKLDVTLEPPDISKIHRYWDACGEMLHAPWTLGASLQEVQTDAFRQLSEIHEYLVKLATTPTWPNFEGEFGVLADRFLAGEIGESEIREVILKSGMHATYYPPNGGDAMFVGEPVVPPDAKQ